MFCSVLYCTVLYCIVLYCTVPYCALLYCTVLCCTVLYCIVLYCTVPYRTLPAAPAAAGLDLQDPEVAALVEQLIELRQQNKRERLGGAVDEHAPLAAVLYCTVCTFVCVCVCVYV